MNSDEWFHVYLAYSSSFTYHDNNMTQKMTDKIKSGQLETVKNTDFESSVVILW